MQAYVEALSTVRFVGRRDPLMAWGAAREESELPTMEGE
jgi:hypothetical protein